MTEKPSRENFYSKRAKKARKHEQQHRERAAVRRNMYDGTGLYREQTYGAEYHTQLSIYEKENDNAA